MIKKTMRNLTALDVPGFAPEDTLLDADGMVYTGLRNDGKILRINTKTEDVDIIAEPGGMPLGLEWLPDGRMLVCNASLGLQKIDIKTGASEDLELHDTPLNVANNAAILPDGTIFVSDSTTRYPLMQFRRDIIEDTKCGRLIRVSPEGKSEIILDGITFANGVVVLPDESAVLVAETAKARIHAVPLNGGEPRIFSAVPGLPDNLSIGTDGLIWLALPSRPNENLDKLHNAPLFIRKLLASLPDSLQPNEAPCCRVATFDSSGTHLHTYEGDVSIFSHVTGVREHHGKVYLGSIERGEIAWFDKE